jgi:hypothetical protein
VMPVKTRLSMARGAQYQLEIGGAERALARACRSQARPAPAPAPG